MLFDQTFKNIRRTREIIRILLKYGFEDVVVNTSLQNFVPKRTKLTWHSKEDHPVFNTTRWERIRMAFEELGPTFVKGAQVLSNRPDILPAELIAEFQKLQNNVAPFAFEKVSEIIAAELGQPIEAIFDAFDKTPIGSASIGQVHLARLKNGERVVVKVQRPDVKNIVETDLSIVKEIVKRGAAFFEQNGIMDPYDVVVAFEKNMMRELDYRTETRNINQFRTFYKDRKDFYVPCAYKEYTTSRVMVLELIEGVKITNIKQMEEWGLDVVKIAETGMHIYLTQIFEFGFFHADPHPGNVLVRKDGVICLIDFGMVGRLSKKDKIAFAGVLISMAQQDARAMASFFRRLALDDDIKDLKSFEMELQEIIDDFAILDVKESNMAELAQRMQKIIYQYRLKVPGSVFIIFRALAILEGIGKAVHPDLNTMDAVRPYGQKLVVDMYSPANFSDDLFLTANDLLAFLNTFPGELKDIVRKLRQGKLHLEHRIDGYDALLTKLDRLMTRASLTLIIVALLIASALIFDAPLAPSLKTEGGIPYISIIGWVLAVLLLLLLLLKSRTQKNL